MEDKNGEASLEEAEHSGGRGSPQSVGDAVASMGSGSAERDVTVLEHGDEE